MLTLTAVTGVTAVNTRCWGRIMWFGMRYAWLLALLGAAGAADAAQPSVGRVDVVEVWGSRTGVDGRGGTLYERDQVYFRDTLQTVRDGAMHVVLRDESVLRLGSSASAVIDEFVYDPAGNGKLAASVSAGIARFITGKLKGDQVAVRTPTATIGVRGTDFSVWVEQSGRTTIWVNQGAISVTPQGGQLELVQDGETVATSGGTLQRNAIRPNPDRGLDDASILRARRNGRASN
jgi:hypothetical protein